MGDLRGKRCFGSSAHFRTFVFRFAFFFFFVAVKVLGLAVEEPV
jgi:hypothetical protein